MTKTKKANKAKTVMDAPTGKPEKAKKEPKRHEPEAVKAKPVKTVKAVKAKPGMAEPASRTGKVKKQPKQAAGACGVTAVDLVMVFPDESASCSLEAATGRLTLRIPQALDGQEGPAGPQGPEGTHGKAGKGLDYSRAPGGKEEFFLLVDEAGRLAYSARGTVSLVNLTPAG
jgi:hypothetical protein